MKLLFLIIPILFSCFNEKTYTVRGTLLEIKEKEQELIIHHDEIPGFMMAMTMPFKISDKSNLLKYEIGDSLEFKLIVKNESAFADNFTLLGKGTIPNNNDWDDEYSPINIGDIFSDATFLNIDSSKIALSDSDGKFRLISFIFSRCPVPNMCPAVIVKNQYLARELNNVEFILISFDYKHDLPSVLKANYGSLIKQNPNINILSSFNHLNDIFVLAGESNVSFWGIDENDIGHTLRSILIDPERKFMRAYDGTDWKPKLVEKEIKNILKTYNF